MGSFLEDMVNYIFRSMAGQSPLSDVAKQFTYTEAGLTSGLSSGGSVRIIYDVFLVIGNGILLVSWLISFFEEFHIRDVDTVEWVTKQFVKLMIGILLLNNALPVILYLIALGDSLVAQFSAATSNGTLTDISSQITYAIKAARIYAYNANTATKLLLIIRLIIPYLILHVVRILIYAVAVFRVIELTVRISFAPMALPKFFHEGKQSEGVRYLKKIAVVIFQSLAITVVVWASSIITEGFMQGNGTMAKVAQALQVDESTAQNLGSDQIDKYFQNGASTASSDSSFHPYGTTTVDEDLESVKVSGESIFDAVFTVSNLMIVMAVQGAAVYMVLRSQSLAEDAIM